MGCVFVIALSLWKTDSLFPGKDSPPRCESSKLNNSPFILLSGSSCICGERACGGGRRAGSLAAALFCNWYPLDKDTSLCIALPTFFLPLFLQQWKVMDPTCVDNPNLFRLSLQCCFPCSLLSGLQNHICLSVVSQSLQHGSVWPAEVSPIHCW